MYLIKQANMLKCTLEPGDRLSETQLMEITSGGHSSLLPCQRAQINGVMTWCMIPTPTTPWRAVLPI